MELDRFEAERDDARNSADALHAQITELERSHNRKMMRTIERFIKDGNLSIKQVKEAAEKNTIRS